MVVFGGTIGYSGSTAAERNAQRKADREWAGRIGGGIWVGGDDEVEEEPAGPTPMGSEPAGIEPPAPAPAMEALDMMMAPPPDRGPQESYGGDFETPLDRPMGRRNIPASSRALAELMGLRGGRVY